MLDGICQALDFVDALGRDLDRLDLLAAALIATHGADVDRPAVGEFEDCVGDRQTADLPAALPFRHDLGAAGVDVHDLDVVGAQQHPATALSPGETVIGFAFRFHSEFAILRRPDGRRLRTVSGATQSRRGGLGSIRTGGSSLKVPPGRVQKSAIAAAISSDSVCQRPSALRTNRSRSGWFKSQRL